MAHYATLVPEGGGAAAEDNVYDKLRQAHRPSCMYSRLDQVVRNLREEVRRGASLVALRPRRRADSATASARSRCMHR